MVLVLTLLAACDQASINPTGEKEWIKTITLPSGEVILDMNGEWDDKGKGYGVFSTFGEFSPDFKEFYFSEPFFQVDLELFKSDEALFLVNNPSYISGMSDLKEVDKEINEDIMVTISSDVYINESYKIINGLINLTK